MKKILVSIVCLISMQCAVARDNTLADYERGFLIGAQAGYAVVDPGDLLNDIVETTSGKFGARLYIGYSFIPYFGIEAGYTYYKGKTYTFPGEKVSMNVYAVDLLAKPTLPLEHLSPALAGWSVYGKLGPVLAFTGVSESNSFKSAEGDVKFGYGLGIAYNFTDHFAVDFTWSGIYGDKINKNSTRQKRRDFKVPSANLFAVGVSYKF